MDGIVSGRIVSYVSVHVYFSAKFGMWREKKRRTETPDANKIAEMRRKKNPLACSVEVGNIFIREVVVRINYEGNAFTG